MQAARLSDLAPDQADKFLRLLLLLLVQARSVIGAAHMPNLAQHIQLLTERFTQYAA